MRNEFTLTEMTEMNLPMRAKDPIYSNRFPSLCTATQNFHKPLHSKQVANENLNTIIVKQIPPTHYIESRFNAYSQAKVYNKPLFTEISKQIEEISEISLSNPRFHSSRYPKVPLTKELSEKVKQINHFREIRSKTCKRENLHRPASNIAVFHKQIKPNMIMLNLKSWDKLKKESLRQTKGVEVLKECNKEKTLGSKKLKIDFKVYESLNTIDTCYSGSGFNENFDRHKSVFRSSNLPY